MTSIRWLSVTASASTNADDTKIQISKGKRRRKSSTLTISAAQNPVSNSNKPRDSEIAPDAAVTMTASSAKVARKPAIGFINRTSTLSDRTMKFRLRFFRSPKSSPVASTNKSPVLSGSSPSLPSICLPSRCTATIAALNRARNPSNLADLPSRIEPGAISTSVSSLCISPCRFANVLRPVI